MYILPEAILFLRTNSSKRIDKLRKNNLIKHLNEIEYDKLLIYILRQEKVLESYFRKGFKEHYNIVKESLNVMYEFKNQFQKVNNYES